MIWTVVNAVLSAKRRYSITYARTFENSVDGDMTKLSLVLDQEIKC